MVVFVFGGNGSLGLVSPCSTDNALFLLRLYIFSMIVRIGSTNSCDNIMHILRNVVSGNQGYATILASKEQSYKTALDKLVQAYKDMAN